MAFEDYKDLDVKPEKATREEIEQIAKKTWNIRVS